MTGAQRPGQQGTPLEPRFWRAGGLCEEGDMGTGAENSGRGECVWVVLTTRGRAGSVLTSLRGIRLLALCTLTRLVGLTNDGNLGG